MGNNCDRQADHHNNKNLKTKSSDLTVKSREEDSTASVISRKNGSNVKEMKKLHSKSNNLLEQYNLQNSISNKECSKNLEKIKQFKPSVCLLMIDVDTQTTSIKLY